MGYLNKHLYAFVQPQIPDTWLPSGIGRVFFGTHGWFESQSEPLVVDPEKLQRTIKYWQLAEKWKRSIFVIDSEHNPPLEQKDYLTLIGAAREVLPNWDIFVYPWWHVYAPDQHPTLDDYWKPIIEASDGVWLGVQRQNEAVTDFHQMSANMEVFRSKYGNVSAIGGTTPYFDAGGWRSPQSFAADLSEIERMDYKPGLYLPHGWNYRYLLYSRFALNVVRNNLWLQKRLSKPEPKIFNRVSV
jgi:hypothetical protein